MQKQNTFLIFTLIAIIAVMGAQIKFMHTLAKPNFATPQKTVASIRHTTGDRGPASMATCKGTVRGIEIEGKGRNDDKAYENAATKCFEKLSLAQGIRPGQQIDEDIGLMIIDDCANIRCQN